MGSDHQDKAADQPARDMVGTSISATPVDMSTAAIIAGGDARAVAALVTQRPAMRDQIFDELQARRGIQFSRQVFSAASTNTSELPDDDKGAKTSQPEDEVDTPKPLVSHRFDSGSPLPMGIPLRKGDHGPHVRKLQQALFDLRYRPISVAGVFDDETEQRIQELQRAAKLGRTDGVVDNATLEALNNRFASLEIYAQDAQQAAPGMNNTPKRQAGPPPTALMRETHLLGKDDKDEAKEALSPDPGEFKNPGPHGTYADKLRQELESQVDDNFESAKNIEKGRSDAPMFEMEDIARVGNAAKHMTDEVFGSYASGATLVVGKNLFDRYKKDTAKHAAATDAGKLDAAKSRLRKIINTEPAFNAIDDRHHANRGRPEETAIITTVVDQVATAHRDQLLLITATWGGHTEANGDITMEPGFKGSTDNDDRETLWSKFGTLVHEYCHSLAHQGWQEFRALKSKHDPAAGQVLAEGITELLARTVLSVVDVTNVALRHSVEGFLYDANFTPNLRREKYEGLFTKAQAYVGVVGINNLYAAYFLGQTQLVQ